MKIIGILGGVASGKSFVADCFRELGAATLDGDRIGHEVLRLPEVEQAARQRWGDEIFDAQGHIDRRKIADKVFAETEEASRELAFLESITHDRIGRRLADEAKSLAESGEYPAAILDAPVLLKAGWDHLCDSVVFVEAPEDIRRERAIARGWKEGEVARRERAQTPLIVKKNRSDAVIDNSADRGSTRRNVKDFWTLAVG